MPLLYLRLLMPVATSDVLRHNPALDGVRGLAVLLVLANHFLTRGDPDRGLLALPFKVAQAGWTGVDLFFVLSGFLITSILWKTKDNEHYFRAFYSRRALRIFPLYYAVLAVTLLLLPALSFSRTAIASILENQAYLWTYTSNFCPARLSHGWLNLGHLWSLAIEEQFYLLWPLLIWRLDRKVCIRVALGAICVSLFARTSLQLLAMKAPEFAPTAARGTFAWTFCRFDSLAMGALIALASTAAASRRRLERIVYPAGAFAAAITGWWVWRGSINRLLSADTSAGTSLMKITGYLCLALTFGAVVVMATSERTSAVQQSLSIRPLRVLGKYSYGLYVFQGLLAPAFDRWWPITLFEPIAGRQGGAFLFFSCSATASLLAAVASWHLFEAPILRFKSRLAVARYVDARPRPEERGEPDSVS